MKRNDINGILLVNKKSGHSSQKMLTKIKKRFNVKIGHTGTLDPLASGLMVVLVGNSCILSSLLIKEDKEYICKMKFGILTSTLDLEGSVIKKENFKLSIYSENDIKEILNKVIGEKDEIPPIYSAIKYNGKKLYEYARDNKISEREKEEILNIKKRKRNIYDIEVLEIDYLNNEIIFKVKCSSGTYIRSLVLEIAQLFGSIGTMTELRRIKIRNFDIQNSFTEDFFEKIDEEKFKQSLISAKDILKLNYVVITNDEYTKYLNGVKIKVDIKKSDFSDLDYTNFVHVFVNDKYSGIAKIENSEKIKRYYIE